MYSGKGADNEAKKSRIMVDVIPNPKAIGGKLNETEIWIWQCLSMPGYMTHEDSDPSEGANLGVVLSS